MARSAIKGIYQLQNPGKYNGIAAPVYRSSWEHEFMKVLDLSESVLLWSSESITIPYQNPLNGRYTVYIPDFFIKCVSGGKVVCKLIEVKPLKETFENYANSTADAAAQYKNQAKWAAAMIWCARRADEEGNPVEFEIMTEADMFSGGKNIEPSKRHIKPLAVQGRVAKKAMTPRKPKAPKTNIVKKLRARVAKASNSPRKARAIRARKIKPIKPL